jgi:hypothetical protein
VSLFKLEFSNRNNLLIYHRYVFIPIGKYLEISDKIPKPVTPNKDLERTYSKDKKLNKNKVRKKSLSISMITKSISSSLI